MKTENTNLNSVNKEYEKLLSKKKSLDTAYDKLLDDVLNTLSCNVKLDLEYHLDKETYTILLIQFINNELYIKNYNLSIFYK